MATVKGKKGLNVNDVEEKLFFIKRNTLEIIGEKELRGLFESGKVPVAYWGTAPTGSPHIGYFFPALKIADLLRAGFKVKILLADMHAALDNVPWDVLNKRYNYYSKVIPLVIECMGVKSKNLEFIKGSDFQLKREYIFDLLKLSSFVSVHDAEKAASEVVKLGDNPKLSGIIYPLMQVLDEEYLKVDVQLGGVDQRKIMVLARETLEKLNYKPRIEIMHSLIPGLIGKKMSASDSKTKIDLLDNFETIKSKMNSAEMVEGNPDNGVMAFLQYVLFPIKHDKKEKFVVERPAKFGGNASYENYQKLEFDFVEKKLHPLDLKNAVAKEIWNLLKPINDNRKELERLYKEAYENN
jgi:tyrosyl-tRNA synthetase